MPCRVNVDPFADLALTEFFNLLIDDFYVGVDLVSDEISHLISFLFHVTDNVSLGFGRLHFFHQ